MAATLALRICLAEKLLQVFKGCFILGNNFSLSSELGAFGVYDCFGGAAHELFVREREESALVECVRCVRDELAEEDFLVAVKGVNHQVQHVANFGLEFHLLCCHYLSPFALKFQARNAINVSKMKQNAGSALFSL